MKPMSTSRSNSPEPTSVAPGLAESLSARSDQDLMDILENPVDWRPDVVDFARAELRRRSNSPAEMDQKLDEYKNRRSVESDTRAIAPMTQGESVLTVVYGAVLGVLGLVFAWHQASRFRSAGFILKAENCWRLYWTAFGVRVAIVVLLVVIAVTTK